MRDRAWSPLARRRGNPLGSQGSARAPPVRRLRRRPCSSYRERSCGGTGRERKEATGKPAAAPGGAERRQLGATSSERKLQSTVPPGGRCGCSPEPTRRSRSAPPARASGLRAPARTGHATAKHSRQRDRAGSSLSGLGVSPQGGIDLLVIPTPRAQRRAARGRSSRSPYEKVVGDPIPLHCHHADRRAWAAEGRGDVRKGAFRPAGSRHPRPNGAGRRHRRRPMPLERSCGGVGGQPAVQLTAAAA